MLNIPVVAQAFPDGKSPYQDPDDSEHMVLVHDNDKWEQETEKLIKDAGLRKQIGESAREYVLGRYDINKNIWRWEQAYEGLLK